MWTAGCQVQPGVRAIRVESSDPTQKTRCSRRASACEDHRRSCLNSPTARDVMMFAKTVSGRICSNLSGLISTSVNCRLLTISDKNAHFFLLESIKVRFNVGTAILRARPGKPAPVPMSTSRQFSTGSNFETYMDSPKWRATISIGSVIDVRLTDRFHLSKRLMYARTLAI